MRIADESSRGGGLVTDERVRQIAEQVSAVVDGLRKRRREIKVELDGLALERERLLAA